MSAGSSSDSLRQPGHSRFLPSLFDGFRDGLGEMAAMNKLGRLILLAMLVGSPAWPSSRPPSRTPVAPRAASTPEPQLP